MRRILTLCLMMVPLAACETTGGGSGRSDCELLMSFRYDSSQDAWREFACNEQSLTYHTYRMPERIKRP